MGYAIAEVCAREGADVILISGPVSVSLLHPNVRIVPVNTAEQMFNACMEHFFSCDAAILSAAVADFTPEITYSEKIKRGKEAMHIHLMPTKDIAAELGSIKRKGQLIAGFALETTNELANAKDKMHRKNFDFIVLNSLRDPGAGFGIDTNKITIVDRYNNIYNFELKSKQNVAVDIVNKLTEMLI